MSTEIMTDPAQTAPPASDTSPATPVQGAEALAPGTLKNGWSTPGAAPPAAADPAQAAPTATEPAAAAPSQAAPASPQDSSAQDASAQAKAAQSAAAAEQAAKAPSEGAAPPAPTENREQLHRRVESRLAELEEARAQLAGHDGNKERARAIETELQVARSAMSGGWEHVGQIEAAHLSQWLSNTSNLIVVKPAADSQS